MGADAQSLTFAMIWQALSPELVLVAAGFLILLLDLALRNNKGAFAPWVSAAAVIVSMVLLGRHLHGAGAALPGMIIYRDDYANVFGLIFLTGALFTLLMLIDYLKHVDLPRAEFSYLILFGTTGAMLMASSLDMVTLFVGLELLSISSYILIGMRRTYAKSTEGAMKYLVLGSVASALILYGMSFVYGLSGSTNLYDAFQQLQMTWASYKFLTLLSLVLMVAGIAIKASFVPFHMWAPDAYEGAPTPVTAFLSVVSKAAAFALLIRIYFFGFLSPDVIKVFTPYLITIAILTMVIGNVAALSQRNMKRILAYSSVAQAGYILVPLCTLGHATSGDAVLSLLSQTLFYLIVYLVMTFGSFGVLAVVTREAGNENIEAFRGLFTRSPFLAVSMTVFLLGLAGMPFTGGFLGKFYIIMGTIGSQYYWLAAVLFAASVISFYYYFGIIRAMFDKQLGQALQGRIPAHWVVTIVIVISLIGTIGLGVLPSSALNQIQSLHWFGGTS